MIPFPGESIGIGDAYDLADLGDFTLWQALWLRGGAFDGAPTSATLDAGETWRAWTYDYDLDYLDTVTPDLVVSWVVEVLSGSATVDVSEGLDPDYASTPDDAGLTPTSLGTVTLTTGTNVIASTISAAHVKGDGAGDAAQVLQLACTAGSAEVQQVKMRVWPAGGPAGAWVDQDSWDTAPAAPSTYVADASPTTTQTVGARADTYADSWDAALALALGGPPSGTLTHRSSTGPSGGVVGIGAAGSAQQALTALTPAISTGVTTTAGIVVVEGRDWSTLDPISGSLVDGVDYSRPPTEVRFDFAYYSQVVGSGGVGWSGMAATWDVSGDEPMGAIGLYATATDALDITAVGPKFDVTLAISPGTALTAGTGATSLPTTSRYVIVGVTHSFIDTAPAWPGTGGGALGGPIYGLNGTVTLGSDATPMQTWATMPGYRVWVPSASPVAAVIPLRQLHRDDGLGGTPPRAFGGASRIRTGRAYGYD